MTVTAPTPPVATAPDKGLKTGALGLFSSVVIGVASTAPAYSLAATLGFVVAFVGIQTPIVVILAFVPILFTSIGYAELNRADPDCGTTFTWAGRAFGPRTGWWGGWGIVAADVLVMASLAQVAGQYVFLLFNNDKIGSNPASGWVLLVGIIWIVVMTYICYRGIEVSANFQKVLLSVEVVMLLVLSVVALVKVGNGSAPLGSITPAWSWFNPFAGDFSSFFNGITLMLFIYWGWDTAVSVNEETEDPTRTPGRAAVISTLLLLATYALITIAAQSFAGVGDKGIGLGNPDNSSDVLSVLGKAVFGNSGFGSFLSHLLILMVLTSAAASTQTTILPTARTTLSMAYFKAIPSTFGKVHRKYLTPTVSTVAMGGISIVLYVLMNYMSKGQVISDAVTAIGVWIAFYYGLTGFTCAWAYRHELTNSARDLWMKGIIPLLGGLILWFAGCWTIWSGWDVATADSYTTWLMPFPPHWRVGGVFLVAFASVLTGLIGILLWRVVKPIYFTGETLRLDASVIGPEDVVAMEAFDAADPTRTHPLGPDGTAAPATPATRPPTDDSPTTTV
jgi:amino acid transporter